METSFDAFLGFHKYAIRETLGIASIRSETFGAYLRTEHRVPCDVPTRPRDASDESGLERVTNCHHDNGYRRRSLLGRQGCWCPARHDDVHVDSGQLARQGRQLLVLSVGRTIFQSDTLTFHIAEITKLLYEGRPEHRVVEQTYPWRSSRRLRSGFERPRRQRPREPADECSAVHHRII